jgi:hypothetical protein
MENVNNKINLTDITRRTTVWLHYGYYVQDPSPLQLHFPLIYSLTNNITKK